MPTSLKEACDSALAAGEACSGILEMYERSDMTVTAPTIEDLIALLERVEHPALAMKLLI